MNRLEQLLQFEKESPKDAFIKYCLALEYQKAGDPETALVYFQYLLHNNAEYVATYYHLGKLYEERKQKEDAEKTYALGLVVAQKISDHHAYSELLNAKNELVNNYDIEFEE